MGSRVHFIALVMKWGKEWWRGRGRPVDRFLLSAIGYQCVFTFDVFVFLDFCSVAKTLGPQRPLRGPPTPMGANPSACTHPRTTMLRSVKRASQTTLAEQKSKNIFVMATSARSRIIAEMM